ncbi:MAG: hypothetical protein K2P59_16505 [Acetatifactor sp.]|nr:hypothetical protein [Acetatifactor sp.]
MELMTGYYRQKEDHTALLLQQYVCRGVPVCLGCICGGESREAGMAGGLFTGQLREEFCGSDLLKAVENRERFLRGMERQLCKSRESCGAPTDFRTAGILCVGERFLLFSQGEVKIVLCNAGFGRPALQEIMGGKGEERQRLRIQWGSMEMGIGILLASESLYRAIPQEDMENCLWVKNINDSRQTQKRVQELGRAAEKRNGKGMGALLLEVRQSVGGSMQGR